MEQPKGINPHILLALLITASAALAMDCVFIVQHGFINVQRPEASLSPRGFDLFRFAFGLAPPARENTCEEIAGQADRDFALGQYAEACRVYGRLIHMQPRSAVAYYGRARCWRALRRAPEAIDDLTTAIQIDPNYNQAYYARGMEYLESNNDLDRAFADFTKCVDLDPNGEIGSCSYTALGRVYLHRGDTGQALSIFNHALGLDPTNAWAYNNIAIIYFSEKNYQKALAFESNAVKYDPQSGHHRFKRGLMYQQLGQRELAQKDFAEAKALGFDVENASVQTQSVEGRVIKLP